jgi:PAS domain S-box-containing protein
MPRLIPHLPVRVPANRFFHLLVIGLLLLVGCTATAVWSLLTSQFTLASVNLLLLISLLLALLILYRHVAQPDSPSDQRLAQLTHLLAATPDFVGISDASGQIIYLNSTARQFIGLQPDDALDNIKIHTFYSPEQILQLRYNILPTVASKGIWQGEATFQSATGELLYVSQVILGYHLPDGSLGYYGTIARDQSERIQTERQLSQYAERLHVLSRMGSELNATLELATILQTMTSQLRHLMAYDGLSLLLTTDKPDKLNLVVHQQIDTPELELIFAHVPMTALEAEIIETKTPLIIANTAVDNRWHSIRAYAPRAESWLSVPMLIHKKVVGLLNISSKKPYFFQDEDLHLVLIFANQCATALINAQLYEQAQQELTVRRQTEAALQRSENRFRGLYETMTQGVIYRDKEGKILLANPAVRHIFRVRDEAALQEEYNTDSLNWDVYDEWGNLVPFEQLPSNIALRTREPILQKLQLYIYRPTGERRWLVIDAIPQFLPDDPEPYQVYVVLNDITLQKETEQALHQAQKLESLGILAGGIAHDFNNLLVALLGQSSLAQRKLSPEHPAYRHIGKVIHAAEHAANLTRQMLAYSGKGQFEVKQLQLNELISNNLELLRVAISKNVRLETAFTPDLPLIQADVSQMQQIVMNLVINAAEAIPNQRTGVVRIKTYSTQLVPEQLGAWQLPHTLLEPGNFVVLVVQDNGQGMSQEQVGRIFDPFFTTKPTGRGLGLAAVLGIMRGHKGGLRLMSELDVGTTFELAFPVSERTPSSLVAAGATPMPTNTNTNTTTNDGLPTAVPILLIDDEAQVREAVVDILQMAGLQVVACASGAEGVAYYAQNNTAVSLIILDLSMPDMDGYETFQELVKLNSTVPILLSSGYSESEAVRFFATTEGQIQPAGFIAKPFDVPKLLTAVQNQLHYDQPTN